MMLARSLELGSSAIETSVKKAKSGRYRSRLAIHMAKIGSVVNAAHSAEVAVRSKVPSGMVDMVIMLSRMASHISAGSLGSKILEG
jgi:hypothetical protein